MELITRKIAEKMFETKGDKIVALDEFLFLPIKYFDPNFEGNEVDTKIRVLKELLDSKMIAPIQYKLRLDFMNIFYYHYYELTKKMVVDRINEHKLYNDPKLIEKVADSVPFEMVNKFTMDHKEEEIEKLLIGVLKHTNYVVDSNDKKLVNKFILKVNEKRFDSHEIVAIIDAINNDYLASLDVVIDESENRRVLH
jgi:rRNA-processing protein FCF1